MRIRVRRLSLCVALLVFPALARAQSLDIQHLEPNGEAAAFAAVKAGRAAGAGEPSLGVSLSYAPAQLVVIDQEGNELGELVGDRLDLWVGGNVGLPVGWAGGVLEGLDLGLLVPATLLQRSNVAVRQGAVVARERQCSGLGDPRLQLRCGLLGAEGAGLDLALIAGLRLPLASAGGYFGGDGLVFTPELVLSRRLGPASLGFNVGYRLRGEANVAGFESDDELVYRTGLSLGLGPVALAAELFGLTRANAPFSGREDNPLELLLSAWVRLASMVLHGGVGVGLTSGYGAPDVRFMLAAAWAPAGEPARVAPPPPPVNDRDGDGVRDEVDKCPDIVEDFDQFDDEDGCPDLDNDDDHIMDVDDLCPNLPEDSDGDMDTDGCPDEDPPKRR